MTYLATRTPRERALIIGAGGLLLIGLIWQLLIMPILNAQDSAAREQQRAIRDYVIVRDGVGALSAGPAVSANREAFNRAAIVDIARGQSLPISRIQVQSDEAIRVWFEDAPSPALYEFMQNLTRAYAAQISRAQISRNQDGSVSAQITLKASN